MLKIICVGKIKEDFYREAVHEYYKRILKYHKIEIIEVMDSNMKKEAELIKSKIKSKDYVVTMEIGGSEMSSVEFANFLDKSLMRHADITFVIGGSDGLDSSVKALANERVSMSKLTFPHQLFRIILLEQIYRGFKIINNESYHK